MRKRTNLHWRLAFNVPSMRVPSIAERTFPAILQFFTLKRIDLLSQSSAEGISHYTHRIIGSKSRPMRYSSGSANSSEPLLGISNS